MHMKLNIYQLAIIALFLLVLIFALVNVGLIAFEKYKEDYWSNLMVPRPGSCGDFWETFADANKNFSSKEEAINFLANDLSKSSNEELKKMSYYNDIFNKIQEKAKNGQINATTLRVVKIKQVSEEHWALSHCGMNLSGNLEYNDQLQVYNVYGEKWFLTQDGRLVHYAATGE